MVVNNNTFLNFEILPPLRLRGGEGGVTKKCLKFVVFVLFVICNLFIGSLPINAIYDPLSVSNNRIGVHILDPSEVFNASQLVNSNGGDWGYVTIPIRSDDRDFFKWLAFFKSTAEYHLIPIIRLATYPTPSGWVAPTYLDIIDFVNFLDLMPWPTQNRYIILFNEPNHAKEWGGIVDPAFFTKLSRFAQKTFKESSPDYYLLTPGLDMSAPTNHTSLDALNFYRQMFAADPNWPDYFDSFSFHPYPNPGFAASPFTKNRFGIRSYEFELKYLKSQGVKPKNIFFTETGTVNTSNFYTQSLSSVWLDSRIVAITPFVLYAASEDFAAFSLLNLDHTPTANYREIYNLPKKAGSPKLGQLDQPARPAAGLDKSSENPNQNGVLPLWQKFLNFVLN